MIESCTIIALEVNLGITHQPMIMCQAEETLHQAHNPQFSCNISVGQIEVLESVYDKLYEDATLYKVVPSKLVRLPTLPLPSFLRHPHSIAR